MVFELMRKWYSNLSENGIRTYQEIVFELSQTDRKTLSRGIVKRSRKLERS
jgi:hypothetical protein